MKEIGWKFKEKREEIGVSREEVSADLGITLAQLDNLEDGNINAFKDIFFLKELIEKYAIYLNLDEDIILDQFNEFVFDFTSKIPVEEIEAKINEMTEEVETKKISSPYTVSNEMKKKISPFIIYIISAIIVIILTIVVVINFTKNKEDKLSNIIVTKGEVL